MVATLRTNMPWLFRTGPGAFANVMENWIHHEDIRRANGRDPRPPDAELDAFLWRSLGLSGRMAAHKVRPFGFELDAGDGCRRVLRDADPRVVMHGTPGEIVLYLSGRKSVAQVDLEGPDSAVQ